MRIKLRAVGSILNKETKMRFYDREGYGVDDLAAYPKYERRGNE